MAALMVPHFTIRATNVGTNIPQTSHFHLKRKVIVHHIFQVHVTIKPTSSVHFLTFYEEVAVFLPRFCIKDVSAQGTCKLALSCLKRSYCWLQLQQGYTQNSQPYFQMAIWSTWLTSKNSHSTVYTRMFVCVCLIYICM